MRFKPYFPAQKKGIYSGLIKESSLGIIGFFIRFLNFESIRLFQENLKVFDRGLLVIRNVFVSLELVFQKFIR